MKAKPQLDEAIAYLEAEIAALCAGEKDDDLVEIAVSIAAGEAPLPTAQFAPLLALWTPAPSSIVSDLAALVDRFEAAKQREEEEKREDEEEEEHRGVKDTEHAVLEQAKGQRRRPRTRPRRRFEDPDGDNASQSASDGTDASSPRENAATKEEKEQMEVGYGVKEEGDTAQEKKDVEMKENTEKEKKKKSVENEVKERKGDEEGKKVVEIVVVKEKRSEKAEAAMASLKTLRKNMLLDVLSKIVSVARSKDVDPAMFTKIDRESMVGKEEGKEQVDLAKIQDLVTSGVICEWAQFAEQVYLFCQHVVTDAEQREQPEARRKGVELLHFARTLTETLRKTSVKKEAILLQKISEANEEAAAGKGDGNTACNEESMLSKKVEDGSAGKNDDQAMEVAASGGHDSSSKAVNGESLGFEALSPSRASTRIRKRTSSASDGTAAVAFSPSSLNSRKRTRVISVSAASASEGVSGSESHDASASEADTKSREQSKTSKSPAKHTQTRRRRPSLPATRISSRQQKRRVAAAAAAAAADSANIGDEEDHRSNGALYVAAEKEGNDTNEKENDVEEKKEKNEQEEEQPALKKKKTALKSRARKKGSRKR
ncbi:unnamed protein product [Peronospora belbahrii]|uniref:Uncharacterized protein n=1 Tax=Peronospora belbahrii TaxID=622444 RepID=A0AAU9L383_9STRA|nr:unnamed protein product [Peronospora belbahrii]CAH0514611.1 unnamed protein product [Peronospora belbahrii]